MRIQHNIMAMNAYRNYTGNVNAMKSNLEKLSSGYKINRAGDDAAGLAISEKMRAQITGLNAAQKNVKDGISLVQTAEGAMQEVQDMLNRMVYLATQSANGTYDNEVDRNNLQKELDQLRSEVDRISDSANFNGIKLLDGSKDASSGSTVNPTTFAGMATGVYVPQDNNTDLINDATGTKQGWGLYTHKDATGEAKTSFEVRLSNYEVTGLTAGDTVKIQLGLWDSSKSAADATFNEVEVTANADGKVTGEMIAKAIADKFKDDGINLTQYKGGAAAATAVNYNVTANGNTLNFVMSDDGYKAACGADSKHAFEGNFNVGIKALKADDTEITTTSGLTDNATSNIKMGSKVAGTQLADAIVAKSGNAGWERGDFKDGSGIKIGDTAYVFAATDETLNAKYDANTKVVDIRDLVDEDGNVAYTEKALQRLSDKAADNDMWSVQVNNSHGHGNFLCVREKETYKGDADLTTREGIEETIQLFSSATANVTEKTAKGTALTFQIGDTAEDFNQLKVSIGDIHTKALGIDGISIANQTSAADAVQKIKDAINTVSSIRGDLGATQNRLEHTQNNLSVMQENITDAESSIRDTDVAEEMMAYTKNNILIQAAQAMLAQANQIPQGVLQLLQ